MKSLILVLLCAFVLGVTSQNIPVKSTYGSAFVDPEELLEVALSKALASKGILKVDVDRVRGSNNGVFKVELYSTGEIDPNLKTILENALTNDLKLTGVTVKDDTPTGNFYTKFYANKMRFFVEFPPSTVAQELQTLAEETMKTTYIELEDSMFD